MLHSPEKIISIDTQNEELAALAPAEVPSRALELAAGAGMGMAVLVGSTGVAGAHEAPASGMVAIEQGDNLTDTFRDYGLTLNEGLSLHANTQYRENPGLVHPGDLVDVTPEAETTQNVLVATIAPGDTTWSFAKQHGAETDAIKKAVVFDLDEVKPGQQVIYKANGEWRTRTIVPGDTIGAIALAEKAPASSFKMLVDFDREKVWPGDMLAVVNTEVNAAQTQQVVVKVERGETLTEIADEHGTTVEAIIADNPRIRNPHHIEAGWDLVVDSPKPEVVVTVAPEPVVQAAAVPVAEVVPVAPVSVEVQKPTDPTDIEAQKAYAWYLLTQRHGLSVNAAGGIMGNIGGESNFAPARVQGRPVEHVSHDPRPNVGYGFAQWTTRGRQAHLEAFAAERGLPVSDPELQVDFIIKELRESFPTTFDRLIQADSIEEASDIFMTEFERPADQSARARDRRSEIGEAVVEQLTAPAPELTLPPVVTVPEAPAPVETPQPPVQETLPEQTPVEPAENPPVEHGEHEHDHDEEVVEQEVAAPAASETEGQGSAPVTDATPPETVPQPEAPAPAAPQHSVAGERLAHPVGSQFPLTSDFGPREAPRTSGGRGSSNHRGTDYGTPVGTPIHAPQDGVVEFAGERGRNGNLVIVDHGPNSQGQPVDTIYAHMDEIAVETGEHVEQGEIIGTTGNTGNSSGPHLHLGVTVGGQHIDPETVIEGPEL